jgi:hypothetical protein
LTSFFKGAFTVGLLWLSPTSEAGLFSRARDNNPLPAELGDFGATIIT